jgi:hypothetical protein
VIHIPTQRQQRVEYLIEQAARGNYPLFDPELLRQALRLGQLSDDEAYRAEPHVERLMLLPTLGEMRAYVASLDAETQARLVRTYLCIVENTLHEQPGPRH